jgi:hypothetical protein
MSAGVADAAGIGDGGGVCRLGVGPSSDPDGSPVDVHPATAPTTSNVVTHPIRRN